MRLLGCLGAKYQQVVFVSAVHRAVAPYAATLSITAASNNLREDSLICSSPTKYSNFDG